MLEQAHVAATPGVDFDPIDGRHYLRFCYAGSQADMTEAVTRIGHWLRQTMTAAAAPAPLPRPVPPLLSFVAGYVDSITFLALFGFFAAQVTGSFVVAAAELVVDDRGVAAKMLAIPAFMLGAGFAAAIIIVRRGGRKSSLPLVFALEALLLAGFVALMLYSWPIADPDSWRGAIAGLLSAAAMGVQSTLVRLAAARRAADQRHDRQFHPARDRCDRNALRETSPASCRRRSGAGGAGREARKRFATVFAVLAGFLVGALLRRGRLCLCRARGARALRSSPSPV